MADIQLFRLLNELAMVVFYVLSMIDIPIVMKKLGRRVNLSFIFVHSFVIDVLFCM